MGADLAAVVRTMPRSYAVGRLAYDARSYERVSRKSKEPFGKSSSMEKGALVAHFLRDPGNMREIRAIQARCSEPRALETNDQIVASGLVGSQQSKPKGFGFGRWGVRLKRQYPERCPFGKG